MKKFIIITSILFLISTRAFGAVYDCYKPNPNGKGVIGFLFDPDNTPQKQCTEELCNVYSEKLKKRVKTCNNYSEYSDKNKINECIAKYKKVYDYNMKEFKSATCNKRHYAIVKYGPGECHINFMIKNGKAKFLDVTGDTPAMNNYHFKCTDLLEKTYPNKHPAIKIVN